MIIKQLIHYKVQHKGTLRKRVLLICMDIMIKVYKDPYGRAQFVFTAFFRGLGLSWVIIIMFCIRRRGCGEQSQLLRWEFIVCITTCGLEDLKSSDAYCTQTNKQQSEPRVLSRLERVLVNSKCQIQLSTSKVHLFSEDLYDYYPTILKWQEDT